MQLSIRTTTIITTNITNTLVELGVAAGAVEVRSGSPCREVGQLLFISL